MHKLLLLTLSTLTSFITFSNISHASTHLGSATELVGKLQGSYSVNQGAFNYSIPIDVPAGINGHIPSLSINYNSQSGNGLLGMGFSLSGLSSIHRCAKTIATDGVKGGINIDENDRLCLDGQRLIAVSGDYWSEGSQYRTEINTYARITYTNNSFKVETKDGNTLYYGTSTDSNIEYQGKTDTKVWALTTKEDSSGNQITYTYYKNSDIGEFNIKNITYADNTIEFSYQDKTVPFTGYQAGSKITSSKILGSIILKTHNATQGTTQSTYHLTYELADTTPKKELLKAVQKCVGNKCLEAIKFEYEVTSNYDFDEGSYWGWRKANSSDWRNKPIYKSGEHTTLMDINGDGLPDRVFDRDPDNQQSGFYVMLNTGNDFDEGSYWGWKIHHTRDWRNRPTQANGEHSMLMDMNGDGLPDRVFDRDPDNQQGGFYVMLNTGNDFDEGSYWGWRKANSSDWRNRPTHRNGKHSMLMDMNGDGLPDRVFDRDPDNQQGGFYVMLNTGNDFDEGSYWGWRKANSSDWRNRPTHESGKHSMLIDMNGDGLPDRVFDRDPDNQQGGFYVMLNTGNDFDEGSYWGWRKANSSDWRNKPIYKSGEHTTLMDINGDGLPDRVFDRDPDNQQSGFYVMLNTGNDFDEGSYWGWKIHHTRDWRNRPTQANGEHSMLMDMNGDGLPDRVFDRDPENQQGGFYVMLNTGNDFDEGSYWGWRKANSSDWRNRPTHRNGKHSMLMDMNGDGLPDRVFDRDPDNQQGGFYVMLNTGKRISLTSIHNQNKIKVNYATLNNTSKTSYTKTKSSTYPNIILGGGPMQVVSGVETSTPTQAKNKTTYRYKNFGINVKGRGSLGFEEVIETNELSNTRVHTKYSQEYPYIGSPLETKSYVNDVLISRSVATYNSTTANKVSDVYLATNTEQSYSYDDGTLLKTTTLKNSAPDEFGNILSITNTIEDNAGNIWTTQTTNEYDNDTTNWHLARLRSAEVTHSSPNPNVPDITKTSAFTYNADGLLETEVIEPQSDTALTTSYTYDSYGNMTSKTVDASDIEPRTTSYTYSDDGKHNTTTTNALGHSESKIYDALGRVKSLTGPNGLTTHWEYDALNRKTKETRADGTTTQWRYEYDKSVTFPNGNKSVYKVTVTKNKVSNATYFDAFDNKLRTTSIGFDGSTIIEDAYYNQLGQITKQSLPYYEGDTAHFVLSTYDDLGRVTSITKKNDTGEDITSTTSYNGYQTTTIDFNGNSKTTTKNAKDKVIRVDEPLGAYLTHTHDSMGNLIETNANGIVTIINYDNRGNKISMNDPSMGIWSYTYDSLGQLKSQTDAKGQVVIMEYDKLGRMKERQEPEGHTTWIYDTQEKGIGKLARVSSPNLLKTYTYDALGRAHETTTHLNGEEYTVTLGYDEHSRVTTKTHPGGFITENVYNDFGYLFAVRSPKEQVTDYDWEHLQGLLDQYLENANQAIRKANHLEKLAREYSNVAGFIAHGINYSTKGKDSIVDNYAQTFINGANRLNHIAKGLQNQADTYRNSATNFLIAANNFTQLINNKYLDPATATGPTYVNGSAQSYYSNNMGNTSIIFNNYQSNYQAGGMAYSSSNGHTYCSNKQACEYWRNHSKRVGNMLSGWADNNEKNAREHLEHAEVQQELGIEILGLKNRSSEYLKEWMHQQGRIQNVYRERAKNLRILAQNTAYWQSEGHAKKIDNESHYEDMLADTGNVYFWRAKSRDAANRLTGHLVGNGLSTENTYNPATGNLLTIESGFSDNNKIRDLAFVYDDNQNVLQRNNNALGVQMNYEYDVLDRLKVTYQSTANTSPLSAQMQDDATLSVYTYDINGNIKTKGAKTLHYEDNSYQVSHATEGNVRTHYDYDENGNMTTVTSELLSAENLKEEEVTIIDYTIHTVYGDGFEFLFNIAQMQALIGRELNRREDFIVTNKRSGKTGFARFYSRKRHHNQPEGTGTASWTGRYNTSYEWQVGDQLTIEMRPKKAINPALVFDIQSANYGGRFKFNLAKVESILGRKLMPNEEFKVTNMSTNRTGIAIFSNEDDPVYGQSSDLLGSGSWKTNSYYGDWSGNDKVMLDISHANQNIPRDKQIRYTSFNKPKSFSGSVATTEFSLPVTSADYSRTLNFKLSDLERITNTELKDGDEFELLGTGSANRHKAALKVRIQLTPNLTHASYQVKNNPSAYGQMYFVKGRHSGNWTHGTVDVKWLTTTQQTTQFLYDENRSRYAKIQNTYSGTAHSQIRTTYIGKSYEKIVEGDKITHKYFIYNADGKLIATHSKEEDSNPFTQEEPTVDKTNYLHYDNLGSIDTITDGQGNIVQQSEYKPFGEQYRIDNNISQPLLTNRGYTGHEHINEFGFIHMNGRVYDPSIGRFLSADPHIQAPLNTQSYNRYSYVLNNPLKYTDPSGYFFKKIKKAFKKIGKFVKKYARTIVAGVIAFYTGGWMYDKILWGSLGAGSAATTSALITKAAIAGGAVGGATFGFTNTVLHGGDLSDAITAAAYGGLTRAITGGISGSFDGIWNLKRVAVSSIGGGINSTIMGGKFKDGFKMAAITGSMKYLYKNYTDIEYNKTGEPHMWQEGESTVGTKIEDVEQLKRITEGVESAPWYSEPSSFMKTVAKLPFFDAMSEHHDSYPNLILDNYALSIPTIPFAYYITVGAYMQPYSHYHLIDKNIKKKHKYD